TVEGRRRVSDLRRDRCCRVFDREWDIRRDRREPHQRCSFPHADPHLPVRHRMSETKMGTRRAFLKCAGASVVAGSTLALDSGAVAETAASTSARAAAKTVASFQSPELVTLYETYTAGPT